MIKEGDMIRLAPDFIARYKLEQPFAIVDYCDYSETFQWFVKLVWGGVDIFHGTLGKKDIDFRRPVNDTIKTMLDTLQFVEFTGVTMDDKEVTIKTHRGEDQ